MRGWSVAGIGALTVLAVVQFSGARVAGQAPTPKPPARIAALPRTSDGRPDLQGTFDLATATPLERPAALAGKTHFASEAEARAYERQAAGNRERIDDAPSNGNVGGYNQFWYEFGTRVVADLRTSLITDPADGRLPAMTPAGQQRTAARRTQLRELADGPEMRDVSERCLLGYNSGPPMNPVGYNQNVQIVQTRDYVMIHNEMVHTARVVPLDNRPHPPARYRFWAGDSVGHWEGDTLIVDTTNFVDNTWNQFSGWSWPVDGNLHVIERFSLSDANTVSYQFTVEDPTAWTRAWTATVPLNRTTNQIYEYACHEGNYGMQGILRGARAEEQRAIAGEGKR